LSKIDIWYTPFIIPVEVNMTGFIERIKSGEILVTDGATGTNLQKSGLVSGQPPESWVLEQPDKIFALASSFVDAGSDIILTCTFGATRLRLRESALADSVVQINHHAVEIARKAASRRSGALVGGSLGPTGLLIKPLGPLSPEEVSVAFEEQAKALTEAGVDLLVIETQFALDEAKAALEGARRVTDLPTVVSFSYDRGVRTMMGVKPSQVTSTLIPLGASVIGANCGTTLENMEKILQEYHASAPEAILWAKPNAGLPEMGADNQAIYKITPEEMGEYARKYIAAGAHIVGGCCGSTPEHIAGIARAVK
jgi:5-methyltetrahydrofolate--homocysteine methyltransferase